MQPTAVPLARGRDEASGDGSLLPRHAGRAVEAPSSVPPPRRPSARARSGRIRALGGGEARRWRGSAVAAAQCGGGVVTRRPPPPPPPLVRGVHRRPNTPAAVPRAGLARGSGSGRGGRGARRARTGGGGGAGPGVPPRGVPLRPRRGRSSRCRGSAGSARRRSSSAAASTGWPWRREEEAELRRATTSRKTMSPRRPGSAGAAPCREPEERLPSLLSPVGTSSTASGGSSRPGRRWSASRGSSTPGRRWPAGSPRAGGRPCPAPAARRSR
ncbi:hypothetical protein PVAP13_9KG315257 [Panicum virgatum]|uniref:Uncharacterized protein n=1 Tax=Panicum virgatum TaxID=38727 RepID=A0A8T0NVQ7_PANVG|nr:hypothetical protein PVAP13_9KG315257 [Panicum virgatum]